MIPVEGSCARRSWLIAGWILSRSDDFLRKAHKGRPRAQDWRMRRFLVLHEYQNVIKRRGPRTDIAQEDRNEEEAVYGRRPNRLPTTYAYHSSSLRLIDTTSQGAKMVRPSLHHQHT